MSDTKHSHTYILMETCAMCEKTDSLSLSLANEQWTTINSKQQARENNCIIKIEGKKVYQNV